jgi:hypothetical protein
MFFEAQFMNMKYRINFLVFAVTERAQNLKGRVEEERLASLQTESLNERDITRATRRNNPEDTIIHSHRRENLKSYINSNNSLVHL